MSLLHECSQLAKTRLTPLVEVSRFVALCLYPSPALVAESLFLRKQPAMYQERQVKPQRATDATRMVLVWLSYFFDWRATDGRTSWLRKITEEIGL